jgi:EF hand
MKCASFLGAAVFACAASVLAQPAARSTFDSLDTDRDGFVTRKEAARLPLLSEGFHIADRNRDGLLERPELEQAMSIHTAPDAAATASAGATTAAAEPSPIFRRLDRNNDGYLDDSELTGDAASRWNWIASDRDGDGRFSPGEFAPVNPRTQR